MKLPQALPLEFSPFFKHLPILNPTYLFSAVEKQGSVIGLYRCLHVILLYVRVSLFHSQQVSCIRVVG